MAKITFVQPAARFNLYSFVRVPLQGSFYLAAILRRKGHDVQVVCEDINGRASLISPTVRKRLFSSDVVGFSILTATANRGYLLAQAVRKRNPDAFIVFGGPHATFLPEEAIQYGDAVVTGEGENVIEEIVAHRPKNAIIRGEPVKSLDDLPFPDYSDAPHLLNRMGFLPVSTSRGCPFDCSFCSVTTMFGRKYRNRSPESVLEEIKLAVRRGWRHFFFVDDNFASDKERAKRILEGILTNNLPIRWMAQARTEVAEDRELVELIRRSGGHHLPIGFESPLDDTLEFYGKRQSREDIIRCVRLLADGNVSVHGMFMLGADTEDDAIGGELLRFCRQLALDSVQFSILTPFPGSRLFTSFRRQERLFSRNWSLYDGSHVVFLPAKMTPRKLQSLWLEAYRKFYTPSSPLNYLLCRYLLRKWRSKTKAYTDWLRALRMSWPPLLRPAQTSC